MPLTIEQNIKAKVWDEVGPKIIQVLDDAWVNIEPTSVAEEIFERIWPDIFSEILDQVNETLVELPMVQAVREKMKSLRENEDK